MEQLPWERMQIAIAAVAKAQAAIDWTIAYVKERKVFGQAVANFLRHEGRAIDAYMGELEERRPFKATPADA